MPIEVELKARAVYRDQLLLALDQHATGEPSVYRDTYYDTPDGALEEAGLPRGEVTSDLWCRVAPLEGCASCPSPFPGSSGRT